MMKNCKEIQTKCIADSITALQIPTLQNENAKLRVENNSLTKQVIDLNTTIVTMSKQTTFWDYLPPPEK